MRDRNWNDDYWGWGDGWPEAEWQPTTRDAAEWQQRPPDAVERQQRTPATAQWQQKTPAAALDACYRDGWLDGVADKATRKGSKT
eukprot:8850341-Lingulodinium_polyedra.AAC.1